MAAIPITSDEFRTKYQLLKEIASGEVRSYHAVSSTGAVVMVHLFERSDTDETQRLLAALDRLPPPDHEKVLRVHDVQGTSAVVTRFILDFTTLADWIRQRTPDQGPAAQAGSGPGDPTGAPAPSEFSMLFPASSPPADPPGAGTPAPPEARSTEPSPPSVVPQPTPEGAGPPAATPEPGEFTRMFRVQSGDRTDTGPEPGPTPAPADPLAEPPAPRDEPPPPAQEPGEFTRMFRSPSTEANTPAPATDPGDGPAGTGSPAVAGPETGPAESTAPAPEPEPGEFTRMFRTPAAPPEPAAPAPESTPKTPAAEPGRPPDNVPGEFTRTFLAANRGEDRASGRDLDRVELTPPGPSWSGEADRAAGGSPSTPSEPPAFRLDAAPADRPMATPPSPPPPDLTKTPAKSGEFTQIFGRTDVPGAQSPSTGSAPPPAHHAPPGSVPGAPRRPDSPPPAQPPLEPPTYPPPASPIYPPVPAPGEFRSPGTAGASEFTRIISAAQAPPTSASGADAPRTPIPHPPPAAQPPTDAAPEPGSDRTTLIVAIAGLSIIVILLFALVLYFVFRSA
jgi:hypothetical protein